MKKVNILVSIYKPNLDYLEKQLRSLDEQDYENLTINIWNDDPDSTLTEADVASYFVRHPYTYEKAKKNLGYAKAFEYLTLQADGDFVAYCDQDDIWMKNKIRCFVTVMERENAVLATGDRAIIDENDQIVIKSCRKEQRDVSNGWHTGDDITPIAVFTTCAIGMNLVIRTETVKELLPLPEKTAHDQWLTAGASLKGKVVFLEEVLVHYRRHGKNVSGVLKGINTKRDYYRERVEYSAWLAEEFLRRFPETSKEDRIVIENFVKARQQKNIRKMYEYRWVAPNVIKFEMLLPLVPECFFQALLTMVRKRVKS